MGLLELYYYYNTEIADVRTNHWPLISSPIPTALISFAYLYFVLRCGPRYMKDKSPYSFHTFIKFYNVFQIVTNSLIVYHGFDAGWYEDYFFDCVVPDYSFNPKPYKIAKIMWYVFILKLIEYIETAIFVLRKKNRQISFLHLYHHVSTAHLCWFYAKYFANGISLGVVIINCSVHVIMYTYYLLSSIGPNWQVYLQPVKRLITITQMVQFVWLIFALLQCLRPSCYHQFVPGIIMIGNLTINFVLFYNFYKKSYGSKKNKGE